MLKRLAEFFIIIAEALVMYAKQHKQDVALSAKIDEVETALNNLRKEIS